MLKNRIEKLEAESMDSNNGIVDIGAEQFIRETSPFITRYLYFKDGSKKKVETPKEQAIYDRIFKQKEKDGSLQIEVTYNEDL